MADALGIDIGGTNVRVATVTVDGGVDVVGHAATPADDVDALVDTVARLAAGIDLPVGIGIAGGITADGALCGAPNLGIDGVQVRERFEQALDRRVVVTNDAEAATWAEYRLGAGREVEDLILLTLGTGVGGGVVLSGRLLEGAHGLGGELGHVIVDEGGRRCPCGNRGCLEAYASGTAMGFRGSSPEEVVATADGGDVEATAHLAGVGTWLGVGLASLANVLDPATILIGGGAGAAAFGHVAPAARDALVARLFGRDHRRPPPVEPATMGDRAGVVGAALLALRELTT